MAVQVSESVRNYGTRLTLRCATVAGGFPIGLQLKTLRRGVDVVIATPGRLLDVLKRRGLSLRNIEMLVLDEADRMLDMGFMPDIKEILKQVAAGRQTLMFSATSSKEIEGLSAALLKNPLRVQIGTQNQAAENVSHSVYFVHRRNKPDLLARLLKDDAWGQVLVFTRTKADADDLKDKLAALHLSSQVIHSGKSQGVRTHTLKRFKSGHIKILIATDVAARGLDIDLLPHVVNFELPEFPDDYVHRIGRTGRAGNKGEAVSLVSISERGRLDRIERRIKKAFTRKRIEEFEEKWTPHSKASSKPVLNRFDKKDDAREDKKKRRLANKEKKKNPFDNPWEKKKSGPPRKKKSGFEKFFNKRRAKR